MLNLLLLGSARKHYFEFVQILFFLGNIFSALGITHNSQTEHIHESLLLDEETSQHIEKDPLDPLNDDFFPEKMYIFHIIYSNAQGITTNEF